MAKEYRKLKGFSSFAYQKLYLGKDHFLVSDGYMVEQYRRLYFADIQLVTLSKTAYYTILNAVFGIGLLIGLIMVAASWSNPTAAWTLGFFFVAIPAAMLLVNLIKGPSCMLEMTTGVQHLKLRCVSRQRKAKSILNRTLPLIAKAQGRETPLSSEELAAGSNQGSDASP